MARLDLATRWAVRASIANKIMLARRAFMPPSSSSREKNARSSALMSRGSRDVRRHLAIEIGHRMIWIPKGEDPLAGEPHQVIGVREHRGHRALVRGLDAGRDGVRIEIGRRL